MGKKQLVLIGAGGFAREVLQLVHDINLHTYQWDVMGFIDDDINRKGDVINKLPILGDFNWFTKSSPDINVAFAVGNPKGRKRLVEKFRESFTAQFPNLIHPSVRINEFICMGVGNIVCESTILTTNIVMGDFNIINLGCTIGHDVVVKDFCTLSPAVNISGNVILEEGCELGTNCCIIQRKTIGAWSVIGAGSVVINDIDSQCTAVGTPAKVIKTRSAY